MAGRQAPAEMYDENIIAWRPGVNKQAMSRGQQSVTFYWKAKLDPVLSREEGRPRYAKLAYVRITQPGDRDNIVNRQAWIDETGEAEMSDNVRFKEHWDHFLVSGEAAGPTGTPLEAWPPLSAEQVEELRHFNIRTVEQLAEMTDGNAQKFMGIRALQRLAKEYLDAAKDGAVVTKLHGELEDLRSRSKSQDAALAEQAETIRQLKEMVEAQQRGRAEAAAAVKQAEEPAIDPEPRGERVSEPGRVEKAGGFLRPGKKS